MKKVEEKRVDVNTAVSMGEVILAVCHPDCITTTATGSPSSGRLRR